MRCFTWENFNENDINLSDSILSEIFITVKKHKMPLLSNLLTVRSGGSPEVRSSQGRFIGTMADLKM